MKTYYFSTNSPADAAGDAMLLPSTTLLHVGILSATKVGLYFEKIDGDADKTLVKLTHPEGEGLNVIKALSHALVGHGKNVIDIVEESNRYPLPDTDLLISNVEFA